MARKQLSDIERLRLQAEDLWEQQQDVLHQARLLALEAGRQGVDAGAGAVRSFADTARERVQRDVLPGLTTALGSAIATLDAFRDRQVRQALTGISALSRNQTPVVIQPPKPKPSVGLWVGIGIGAVAAAAVGYVVWQTLRADDDLWIEEDLAEVSESPED